MCKRIARAKRLKIAGCICLLLFVSVPAISQELAPTRIVGMEYPPIGISARIQGSFRIKCNLSPEGKVLSSEIMDTVSRPVRDILGKAAQENISEWVFPSTNLGQERSVVITYKFGLEVKHEPSKESRFVYQSSPSEVNVTAEIPDVLLP